MGLPNTKGPVKLVLGTVADYKRVFHLQIVKYFQIHKEDEPRNTIDVYQIVGAIVLEPQYNLQGGFLNSLIIG